MSAVAAGGLEAGGLVLGTARCGSTLVSAILRAHPAMLSLSELFSTAGALAFRPSRPTGARFWRGLATPSRALSAVGNPQAAPGEFLYGRVPDPAHDPFRCPPILAVTLPHLTDDPDAAFADLGRAMRARGAHPIADQYRALFAALAPLAGRPRVWVERSGGSLVAAGTLRAMFPEARTVLVWRGGVETAASMRDYPAARAAIWTWRVLRRVGIDLLDPQAHYGRGAAWPLVSAIAGRAGLGRIVAARPTLEACGAFWSAVVRAGLPALDRRDAMVLRYDDLCRDPRAQIARLGLHLAGEAPEPWLEATRGLPRTRPSRAAGLDRAERDAARRACAPGEAAFREWAAR